MNYMVTVEITLKAEDDIEAVDAIDDLMGIYRSLNYIEEWGIVDVEELTS